MGATVLAFSVMSDHCHIIVSVKDISAFVNAVRISYTKHFNSKYHRAGRLGEKSFYSIELCGLYHTLAAIDYVLRNAVHHGVTSTPFEYPYNSSNFYFRKELCHLSDYSPLQNGIDAGSKFFMSKNSAFPHKYEMAANGLICNDLYIDSSLVEKWYGTARGYLYHMNRLTSEEWLREQKKDGNASGLITMGKIEKGIIASVSDMLANERKIINARRKTDIEICLLIDGMLIRNFKRASYCQLTAAEKETIARALRGKYYIPKNQIIRCLAIDCPLEQ